MTHILPALLRAGLLLMVFALLSRCQNGVTAVDQTAEPPDIPKTVALPPLPPPTRPFTYETPTESSAWMGTNPNSINGRPIGPVSAAESSILRVEVRRDYGGSIQIYDKVSNQALINFYDMGRESGMASYGGPRSFADDSPRWKNIGYNPLQAGDDGFNPSPILVHGIVNGWIYTKAQCLSWAHQDARRLPFFYEQWVGVDSNKVHVKVRLTHQRPDKTFYNVEEQEWPMMMISGHRRVHFYTGSRPYQHDLTTVSDGIERSIGSMATQQSTPFYLTEPWEGVEIAPDRLIGLYSPGFFRANYNVAALTPSPDNSEGSLTLTYVGNRPMVHLDSDNIWHKDYTYILGSEQDIRQYVYAQPRQMVPDFTFNKAGGRNGWFIQDGGYDQQEPFSSDDWRVMFTGKTENGVTNARGTKLISTTGSWPASQSGTLYIRMAYTGPPGAPAQVPLRLAWLLNGQEPNGFNSQYPDQNRTRFPRGIRGPDDQYVPLVVQNDGQMHTYKLTMTGHPAWKDVVQQFEIAHNYSPAFVAPGEVLTLRYFGTHDPGQ
ncbi:hypothetical protein [Spirosoma sp. 209]|uniref:hypothetical protein n=1 Tax=Spirosoma sp. 209 TaxID=1955701 RepID=UPI00098CF20D|nr:hypothetical protein [Spirosoma sp. 209]